MNVQRAAQILLTILIVAIAAKFGTNSQFYTESLSSAFLAIALVSVVIVHLRVCPVWPDALIVASMTALLAAVDFRLLSYTPRIMAWFSFAGLSSLLLLAVRTVWAAPDRRKLLLFAFVPSLLFVASEWFASTMLDWTEKLHPRTLDLFLYSFDGSLRVQLSFLMGQAFQLWPWFKVFGTLFYISLPIPIALVYSGQLLRTREKAIPAMAAFLLTGPIGIIFYNIFPAMGPIHLVHGSFPWSPLPAGMWPRVLLEPVALHGPRNAIPSLHMGWVLLAWWYSRGLSWWERGITFLFVFFTVCGTMGTGEHYFIDLVVAYPFALLMQALCAWPLWRKDAGRVAALLFALPATLAWLIALRLVPHFFWISPILPWVACAASVALTIWFQRRLENSSEPETHSETGEDAPAKPVANLI